MGVEEIYSRRSIRKYKEEKLSIEDIYTIIDAGRVAPSGGNKQPWKFLVYEGTKKEELLEAMKTGIQRERRGNTELSEYFSGAGYGMMTIVNTFRIMQKAPVVIMILNPYGKSPYEQISISERVTEIVDNLSIGGAIENMMLRAEEMGIGSLCVGATFWAYSELMKFMNVSGQLVGCMVLGFADEMPKARPRKELVEVVEFYMD